MSMTVCLDTRARDIERVLCAACCSPSQLPLPLPLLLPGCSLATSGRGDARRRAATRRDATQRQRYNVRLSNDDTRRAKGNPVPIPEPGRGTACNSGPRKSVRRGNPK